jgi:hypothetical protein
MKVKNWSCPNISIWYFFWLQIARWFQKYKNFVVWRSTLMLQVKMIKNWRNFKISYILTLLDLQWVKLTFKQQNVYIIGISEQFAIIKSIILISRATSIFDLHMRIFSFQGLGAPDKPKKKKNKYAEIDFTSRHSFLRVRQDQFRQNLKKTHPTIHSAPRSLSVCVTLKR